MRSNIATAINAAHSQVEAAKQRGVAAAAECGKLLCEAKETVAHGKWDAWIAQHCSFSARTAQLYMRVHRHLVADPAKAQRVSDLALRDFSSTPSKKSAAPAAVTKDEWVDRMQGYWLLMSVSQRRAFVDAIRDKGDITNDQAMRMLAGRYCKAA